jgi:hypothetical protein
MRRQRQGPDWSTIFAIGSGICVALGVALLWTGGPERALSGLQGTPGGTAAGGSPIASAHGAPGRVEIGDV